MWIKPNSIYLQFTSKNHLFIFHFLKIPRKKIYIFSKIRRIFSSSLIISIESLHFFRWDGRNLHSLGSFSLQPSHSTHSSTFAAPDFYKFSVLIFSFANLRGKIWIPTAVLSTNRTCLEAHTALEWVPLRPTCLLAKGRISLFEIAFFGQTPLHKPATVSSPSSPPTSTFSHSRCNFNRIPGYKIIFQITEEWIHQWLVPDSSLLPASRNPQLVDHKPPKLFSLDLVSPISIPWQTHTWDEFQSLVEGTLANVFPCFEFAGRGAGEGQPMNIPCQIAPLGTNPQSLIQPLNPVTVKVTAPRPTAGPDGSSGPMTFTLNPQDIYRAVLW